MRATLPELPDEKKGRFAHLYGLSSYDAGVLVAERETAEFFEAVAAGRDAKTAANWVINELAGRLNKEGKTISISPVSAAQLGSILDLIAEGTISGKIAKLIPHIDAVIKEAERASSVSGAVRNPVQMGAAMPTGANGGAGTGVGPGAMGAMSPAGA